MSEAFFEARLGDRSLFPQLEARVYLNHGAISPPSAAVHAAVLKTVDLYAHKGLGAWATLREQREGLRQRLADLIGAASAADIGFVPSTTQGVISVAQSIPWRAGDRVLCFAGEFPTNVTPWQRAAETFGLEVELLPLDAFARPEGADLSPLEAELKRGARLVAVSAVQFQTGLRMPLEAIGALCRQYGAELAVDAIQAVGVVPMDVQAAGVDYLACGSHKWLMAMEGCGFVYINPARVGAIVPRLAGWLSHEEPIRFLLEGEGHLRYDRPIRREANYLEVGALNVAGFASLDASLALIEQLGVERIFAHVTAYLDALELGLMARGFRSRRLPDAARRSGILSVRAPEGSRELDIAEALNAAGVLVTAPDGNLRLSPHWPNALSEVDVVLEAVDESLEALRSRA